VCKEPLEINVLSPPPLKEGGTTWAYGGNENVRVVLGRELKFTPSLIGRPLPRLEQLKIEPGPIGADDKIMLVCFFDMNQRPSRNCLRQLSPRAQELKAKDVEVVAVHAPEVDEEALNAWVKKNGITFPVGMVRSDEEETRFVWGVRSLPWQILTDRQHVVQAEGFSLAELGEKLKQIAGE
jgi:hypothetical protein